MALGYVKAALLYAGARQQRVGACQCQFWREWDETAESGGRRSWSGLTKREVIRVRGYQSALSPKSSKQGGGTMPSLAADNFVIRLATNCIYSSGCFERARRICACFTDRGCCFSDIFH